VIPLSPRRRGVPVFCAPLLPLWLFLTLALPARGEEPEIAVFQHPLGPPDLGRYREICGVLSARPLIRGNFTQKRTIGKLNRSLESAGVFIIAAERGMVWDTRRPFPSVMTLGRDYLLQSGPGGERAKLDAGGNETFLRFAETISAVFSGDADKLLENFDNYFYESRGTWTLGLTPREKTLRGFAQRIVLEGDEVIRRITLYEQNGDTLQYALSDHVFPAALEPHEAAFFVLP
jgi:hypothetical protein